MTIYDIKHRVTNAPHFFDRKTLKFFKQTMRDFSVRKMADGRYFVSAPMRGWSGEIVGKTERIFNPVTNEFERE